MLQQLILTYCIEHVLYMNHFIGSAMEVLRGDPRGRVQEV